MRLLNKAELEKSEMLNWKEFFVNAKNNQPWHKNDPEEDKEIVRVGIRLLTNEESNNITEDLLDKRALDKGKTRTYRYSANVLRKMDAAIVQWEGITDAEGQPALVSEKALALLPNWVAEGILKEINAMNGLSEDEELD